MISVREMTDGDRAYVLQTWTESEEDRGAPPGCTSRVEAFAALRGKARALVSAARVLVAHPDGDSVTVLGWMCAEPPLVHYAYTRRSLRRHGIASMLLRHHGIEAPVVTCAPPSWRHARARYDARIGWVRASMAERS